MSSSNRHDILQCFMSVIPGHAVAQLLEAMRYGVGNVAGSIPDGVIGIFR